MSLILIPSSETSLVTDVVAGQADIAASLLRTFERDDQVAFAKPWRTGIRELIVTGPGTPPLVSLEDVGGRAIHVRRNSDHHASLLRLNDQLKKIDRPPAKVVLAAESQTDEDLLELVNSGHDSGDARGRLPLRRVEARHSTRPRPIATSPSARTSR